MCVQSPELLIARHHLRFTETDYEDWVLCLNYSHVAPIRVVGRNMGGRYLMDS